MSLRRPRDTPTFQPAASQERRKWTADEDDYLRSQVEKFQEVGVAIDWTDVAEDLDGRTNKDCRKRWLKIDTRWNTGAWSPDEDNRLRDAVVSHEGHWRTVSDQVRTRNPDQCAKRWKNSLDPQIKRNEWTADDDEMLIAAVAALGRNWRVIATTYFKTRSRLDLSNRYAMLARKNLDADDYRRIMLRRTPSTSPPYDDDAQDGHHHDTKPALSDLAWARSTTHGGMLPASTRAAGAVPYRPHPAVSAAAEAVYAPQQRSVGVMGIETNMWSGEQMMFPSYVAMSQAGHGTLQAPVAPMNPREQRVKVEYERRVMTPPASDGNMHHSRPASYY